MADPDLYGSRANDDQSLLGSRDSARLQSENRRTVLTANSSGRQCACLVKPRVWALILVLLFIIAAIVVIVVVATANRNGQNAKQVQSIIAASQTAVLGYNRLGYMLDTYGPRISGSTNLNDSLSWMAQVMSQEDGFEVSLEPVNVSNWVRNSESLTMSSPVSRNVVMLGLGGSVGTPAGGITAQVMVVKNYEELDARRAEVPGKIVLYNNPWNYSYGNTVMYRSRGAVKASLYGAVAVLVRSVTPLSLKSPHTGSTNYDSSIAPPIPAAAITVEDASWMGRIMDRSNGTANITVTLYMGAQTLPDAPSFNLVASLRGSKYPDQYVLMGGHTDSWDVGQGAHDDMGGVYAAWEALRLIKSLGLVPQRTIRVVGWVDEEQGGSGGNQYVIDHASEIPNTILAMESDAGTFVPTEMAFKGTDQGISGANKIGYYYLSKLLNVGVVRTTSTDADITPLGNLGVPCFSLRNSGNTHPDPEYFYYHHTQADTFDKIKLEDFNLNAAVFAVTAWVAAQGEFPLK